MSEKTFVSDIYIEKEIKMYFRENLPQYVEGEEAWKINWNPNIAFDRPDDLYWLDFHFKVNEPYQQELGTAGRNRWTGILQINICVPKDEVSMETDEETGDILEVSAINTCYDDIARVFRRGVIFNGIRIHKTYRNSSAMQVYDDFCCQPVTIEWQSDLNN